MHLDQKHIISNYVLNLILYEFYINVCVLFFIR